jgi:hypothetical protein
LCYDFAQLLCVNKTEYGTEMSNIVEAGNIGDVSNTRNAIRKIRLKILKILDEKCPVETSVTFGDGGDSTIIITFLEREHERLRKPTGGGRGSRERRRRKRQQQRMQQHEQQQQLQQAGPAHNLYEQQQPLQQTAPEQFSAIITADEHDIHPGPSLDEYNIALVEQNSSPTFRARIAHSGHDQGQLQHQPRIHNIPTGWPRLETVAAREESNNNQQHLLKLLMGKMEDMDAELNSLKDEHKNMIKTTEQLQCSVKRIREVKEKNVFCWHCMLYTSAIHFCLSESKLIHLDRFNRIITYAATQNGATPTHPNDHCDASVIGMQKFSIDNREEIIIDRKEEEAKRKKQEQDTC